jgi:riboflavin biosynthesis pyrimidine reductase
LRERHRHLAVLGTIDPSPSVRGSGIITSLLLKRLADKIVVAIAPKILGKGIEAVGALGILEIQKSLNLSFVKAYKRGSDLIIKGNLSKPAS